MREGWAGWDEYAPFYDWENAQTLGRRDIGFWTRVAKGEGGRLLELGCGTGRLSVPLARAGNVVVGLDRSEPMLVRARKRAATLTRRGGGRLTLVRGDIRQLPFEANSFAMVLAPYGMLQSLLRDEDLRATLGAAARVVQPGGLFGIDLVPDVPRWREYTGRTQLRGRAGRDTHLTLIESVRQKTHQRLTIFDQTYVVRHGGKSSRHRFELRFRTLSVRQMTRRLERAGFAVEALLGDYRGRPWHDGADAWIILARRA